MIHKYKVERKAVGEREGEREREILGLVWAFETTKPVLSGMPLLTRPHLILPKQFTYWGPSIQTQESLVAILIQTTKTTKKTLMWWC